MAQTGALAALVAVLGLASTLPGGSSGSDVRTTPAALGQSADAPGTETAAVPGAPSGSPGKARSATGDAGHTAGGGSADEAANQAVGSAAPVTTVPTPVTTTTTMRPPATSAGQEIAFVRESRIWLVGADGSNAAPLTAPSSSGTGLIDPDWAPDGRRLVAVRTRNDGTGDSVTRLVLVGLDGAEQPLTPEGRYGGPQWSPDGSRIAFARRTTTQFEPPKFDLWLVNADGSDERKVRTGIGINSYSWSSDGSRLAFSCTDGTSGAICTMRPDGSDVRSVPNTTGLSLLALSPDGLRLAAGTTVGNEFKTVVQRLDGTDRRVVADGSPPKLDWSGDGRHVVFPSTEGCSGCYRLWVVSADGSDRRTVTGTTNSGDTHPTWRP